jgi:hypothetical protein
VKSRGRILVIGLLGLGLAAALAAVWQQHRQSRQALGYWGVDVVELIAKAERVKLVRLEDAQSSKLSSKPEIERSREINLGHAPGLVHFRHSLLEDINFDWERRPNVAAEDWDYAVHFSDGEQSVTILFDVDGASIWKKASDLPAVGVTERMARGCATFFEEQLLHGGNR